MSETAVVLVLLAVPVLALFLLGRTFGDVRRAQVQAGRRPSPVGRIVLAALVAIPAIYLLASAVVWSWQAMVGQPFAALSFHAGVTRPALVLAVVAGAVAAVRRWRG